jgi:2-oxo-3-hexenedioate decarboxylase
MAGQSTDALVERVSDEVLATLAAHSQIASIAARETAFDLATAYRVTARVCEKRKTRGETPIGRKLGFTNRTIWDEYKVYAPIWSYVYDTTVRSIDPSGATFDMSAVVEPRIEPEITLALGRTPEPGMNEAEILGCIDWVAHGFEVVQSLFPGWKFAPADTVAAFGLHGALLLGPRHEITGANRGLWFERLTSFEARLWRNSQHIDTGHARNVLGGPLSALRDVIAVLANDPYNPPLAAGEIITTGTVTRAFPMQPGETWRSEFSGAPFEGITLHVA